jgi:cytochrome b involved in lipid metabolism/NAD(P)H-flavin reductase
LNWNTFANQKMPTQNLRKIPRAEVMLHDKPTDMWMVLHGHVYDCTSWAKYHPGGVEVMMQCAGRDGTALYDYYHKWVNLESLLAKFCLGTVAVEESTKAVFAKDKTTTSSSPMSSGIRVVSKEEVAKHNQEGDCWIIIDGKVYDSTQWLDMHPGGVGSIMSYAGSDASDEFRAIHSSYAREKLTEMFVGDLETPSLSSPGLSTTAMSPITPVVAANASRALPILGIQDISHNVKLFRIDTRGMRYTIPTCGHISIENPQGVRRSYTPILVTDTELHIIIKKYPAGAVSSYMHDRKLNDEITVLGPFAPRNLKPFGKRVLFVAGGTGLAPFIHTLREVSHKEPKEPTNILLLNCNRSAKDILMDDLLTEFTTRNPNIEVLNVLSQDEPYKSRLTEAIVVKSGGATFDQVVVCGPVAFNKDVGRIMESVGYSPSSISLLE